MDCTPKTFKESSNIKILIGTDFNCDVRNKNYYPKTNIYQDEEHNPKNKYSIESTASDQEIVFETSDYIFHNLLEFDHNYPTNNKVRGFFNQQQNKFNELTAGVYDLIMQVTPRQNKDEVTYKTYL